MRRLQLKPASLLFPKREHPAKVQKILLIRADRLGDAVLSIPFFADIRAAYPAAEICLLCRPAVWPVIKPSRLIDRCIAYTSDMAALLARLRTEKFDLAVDLHYDTDLLTAFICRMPLRAQAGFGESDTVVGSVARLEPVKGETVFARAIPEVLKKFPAARFIIVGDGAQRGEMENILRGHDTARFYRRHRAGKQVRRADGA